MRYCKDGQNVSPPLAWSDLPAGRTIRYRFRLSALHQPLELPPGLDKKAFLEAASGHVLAQSDLIATYERRP